VSRTVTALYDSRAEAETAQARLLAEVDADALRILHGDDPTALQSLDLGASATDQLRKDLQGGGYLLTARIASGARAERIVTLLEEVAHLSPATATSAASAKGVASEELRVGERIVERGRAKVDILTPKRSAQSDSSIDRDPLAAGRRLSVGDFETRGLLKDRVIEFAETQEEPVIAKDVVLREEVVLKKRITERTETIRDTVRHTEVEVEELPPAPSRTSLNRDGVR
jgi:hypothetical protein